MSPLSYSNFGEAFMLGSDQIKNTQEEIAKLKALVMDSSINPKPPPPPSPPSPPSPPPPQPQPVYSRIGPPPSVSATFTPPQQNYNFDDLLSKLIQHPKFDDIVKNYVSVKHPEWILKETNYSSKSTFGAISPETCSTLKNVITFLIIIVVIYFFVH